MIRTEWQEQLQELRLKLKSTIPGSPEDVEILQQYTQLLAQEAELEPDEPVETPTDSTESHPSREIHAKRDYFEHVDGNVEFHTHLEKSDGADPAILQETYLRRLLHTTSQLYLTGIDRKLPVMAQRPG